MARGQGREEYRNTTPQIAIHPRSSFPAIPPLRPAAFEQVLPLWATRNPNQNNIWSILAEAGPILVGHSPGCPNAAGRLIGIVRKLLSGMHVEHWLSNAALCDSAPAGYGGVMEQTLYGYYLLAPAAGHGSCLSV